MRLSRSVVLRVTCHVGVLLISGFAVNAAHAGPPLDLDMVIATGEESHPVVQPSSPSSVPCPGELGKPCTMTLATRLGTIEMEGVSSSLRGYYIVKNPVDRQKLREPDMVQGAFILGPVEDLVRPMAGASVGGLVSRIDFPKLTRVLFEALESRTSAWSTEEHTDESLDEEAVVEPVDISDGAELGTEAPTDETFQNFVDDQFSPSRATNGEDVESVDTSDGSELGTEAPVDEPPDEDDVEPDPVDDGTELGTEAPTDETFKWWLDRRKYL